MESVTQIKCPNCGNPIDVNDILYHQLEEEMKKKFQLQLTEERKKFEGQSEQLRLAGEKLKEEKGKIEEQISEGIRIRLRLEKETLEKQIKQRIEEEEAGKFKVLQEELNEKSARLKEFNQALAEIEKLTEGEYPGRYPEGLK
jgi:cellulose biosynthesis protein BcsQ